MNEETKTMTQETQNREEFIMLPTVDFCFKELMQNARYIKKLKKTATFLRAELYRK